MFGFFVTPFYFILPLIIFVLIARAASGFFRGVNRRPPYREFPQGQNLSDQLAQRAAPSALRSRNNNEARIFKLAQRLKGRVTLSDIVVETGLNLRDAEELIDGLVDNVHVRMEVDNRGMVFYEFPEIMRRFESGE
jgi:hypothetical protein